MANVAQNHLTDNDDPGGNGHDAPDAAPTIINPDATATLSETAETAEIAADDNDHDMPDALPSLPAQRHAEERAALLQEYNARSGRIVAYRPLSPCLLEQLLPPGTRGLPNAAILLAQLVYWHGKGKYGDWTYKRDVDMRDETGLSRTELQHAKSLLKKTHLVAIEYHGTPPTTWYRVDLKNLVSLIRRGCGTAEWEGR